MMKRTLVEEENEKNFFFLCSVDKYIVSDLNGIGMCFTDDDDFFFGLFRLSSG
jgi:hypothetical protein